MAEGMSFRKGGEYAEQNAASKRTSNFARVRYFSLEKENDSALVRFLQDSDDWITIKQHLFIATKGKPADFEGDNWPTTMSATCRMEPAFNGKYADCFICDNLRDNWHKPAKPKDRLWTIGCLREEKTVDGRTGIGDKTIDIAEMDAEGKPTGNTITVKDIRVFNFGWDNFFGPLYTYKGEYGTLLDRDYKIRKVGTGTDTEYRFIPQEKTSKDLRDPETMARYKHDIDLESMIADRASDDYYARFFDTRVSASSSNKKKEDGAPADQQSKPANDMTGDEVERRAAMKNRLAGYADPDSDVDSPSTPEPVGVSSGGAQELD